jgi:hypothetical protein
MKLKLLNVVNFWSKTESENINQMITIGCDFYPVIFMNRR